MSAVLFALAIGLGQGLLHGLGPDHCAAVATLGGADARRRSAVMIALRFAVGHTLVLGGLAAVCLLAGVGISEAFERWAEIFGGAVLLALALSALFFPDFLRHGHPHLRGHDESHVHPPARSSATVSTAAGALMAVSGV